MNHPATSQHTPARVPEGPPVAARVGLIQSVLDGLFEAACVVCGDSLKILAVNAATAELFGRERQALIGQDIADLAETPEEHLFWMGVQTHALAGISATDSPQTLHSETLLRRADEQLIPVERRIVPIELPSGHPAWLLTWIDLSPRQQLQDELDRLAAQLGSTLESSTDAILVTDLDGASRGCNRAYLRLFGLPEQMAALDPRVPQRLLDQAEQIDALNDHLASLRADPRRTAVRQLVLKDGRILEHRSLPQYARGEPIGHIHSLRDLSEQLAAQARLRMVADVFDALGDAIFVLDQGGLVLETNRAAEALTGQDGPAWQDQSLADALIDPVETEQLSLAIHSLATQGRWDGEMVLSTPQGMTPVQVQMIEIQGASPKARSARYVVIARDLSEHKAQQSALLRLSHSDVLTGLPNHARLRQQVAEQIVRLDRETGRFALMSIGLDRFKHISNALGHSVADRVIVEVARRLADCVRQDDVVAHLGTGAFVIMLARGDGSAVQRIAERVLEVMAQEMVVEDMHFNVGGSIGAAVYPADGTSVDELLTNADNALQAVQASGQGGLRFYQPRMNSDLRAKVQMDHAMREGLRARRFHLHYQPQVSLQDGTLVGAEALLRWNDPVHGEVSPARFIPVAEETGFIAELGDFVLNEAVGQSAAWLKRGLRVPIGVNISALQFQQPHFVERVFEVLAAHGLPGDMLELELTESILLGDMSTILAQLHELAAQGVRLAIDDFGTGYSSLGYLKRLPIDRLKIDRSFVQDLPDDVSDTAIVRSVVEMAKALDLVVIAEGVETEAQRDHLARMGCHEGQGYLFARPLSLSDFELRYAAPAKSLRVVSKRAAA